MSHRNHTSCYLILQIELLISVVTVSRENIDVNLFLEDSIHQTMLFSNRTTPTIFWHAFQRLRMSRTGFGMLFQFLNKLVGLLICCRFRPFQFHEVFNGLGRIYNFIHQPTLSKKSSRVSPGSISRPSPRSICFSAFSTRAKNSSRVISVESACFSDTSLRRYLAARFSNPSSSAIILILRKISALRCTVLMSYNLEFRCKGMENNSYFKISKFKIQNLIKKLKS